MLSTRALLSDKARCFSQSEHPLYGNFIIINKRGKWLGRPVNIKEANKHPNIYVGRSLARHISCFMLIEYAWNYIIVLNAFIGLSY